MGILSAETRTASVWWVVRGVEGEIDGSSLQCGQLQSTARETHSRPNDGASVGFGLALGIGPSARQDRRLCGSGAGQLRAARERLPGPAFMAEECGRVGHGGDRRVEALL